MVVHVVSNCLFNILAGNCDFVRHFGTLSTIFGTKRNISLLQIPSVAYNDWQILNKSTNIQCTLRYASVNLPR